MQIHIEKLEELKKQADAIFISADGEKVIVKVFEIQKQVEEAMKEIKATLLAKGLEIDPNFTSIQGDLVKVSRRAFGSRYQIDEAHIELAPKELYTVETKTSYKLDGDAVEKWAEEHKGMPAGIIEIQREKVLSISLKEKTAKK